MSVNRLVFFPPCNFAPFIFAASQTDGHEIVFVLTSVSLFFVSPTNSGEKVQQKKRFLLPLFSSLKALAEKLLMWKKAKENPSKTRKTQWVILGQKSPNHREINDLSSHIVRWIQFMCALEGRKKCTRTVFFHLEIREMRVVQLP